MTIKPTKGDKLSITEISFIGLSVSGALCNDILGMRIAGERGHGAGYDVVAIKLMDHCVELLTIEA